MTESEFEALIARGHETNGVEFKGPGLRTEKAYLAKVVRAVLGMANRRDGGLVILGVDDGGNAIGLDDGQLETWNNYDVVSESINIYASPNVSIEIDHLNYKSKDLIILNVSEFGEIPIICGKEYKSPDGKIQTLRTGALYVRSRHKPETAEIRSEEELRELLELAVDKGLSKFVERARKAGLYSPGQSPLVTPSDEERYDEQLEDIP